MDKRESRKHLGLPEDKEIVLFVSDSVNNKRKGFHLLEKAIIKANNSRIMLCSVGKNLNSSLPEVHDFSEVHDEHKLALIYSAADVFVLPALEDNLPNVVIESICCGTPVVGFNIGGMPDMIEDGVNGRLAKDISAEGLLASLNDVLNNGVSKTSGQISQHARNTYSQSRQAEMFNLYLNDLRNDTSYRKP
jgi:glycosyltransferase involved in cell wall biosynthesis